MPSGSLSRVGILAGGGRLPREIAESVIARGGAVQIVSIAGEADDAFEGLPRASVRWGEIGRIISLFRAASCRDLVIVGRVRRPDLRRIKPDLGFFLAAFAVARTVASGGDDSVLRSVIRYFEDLGFRILGPADVAPELLIGRGSLGDAAPSAAARADIALGFELVRRLGVFDIGQAAVVANGRVLAIEGAEGTDAMLARVARERARTGGGAAGGGATEGGVLVKAPKPGQDLRVDLPAIGPETVTGVLSAGLAGVAVMAGRVLGIERAGIAARANAAGIFVHGADAAAANGPEAVFDSREALGFRSVGRIALRRRDREDANMGAAVIRALEPWGTGRCAAVIGGHIRAVETGEGVAAMLERTGALRQWGRRRRAGLAVLARTCETDAGMVAAAAAARLSGLAVLGPAPPPAAVALANKTGLFIAAPIKDEPEPA